MKRRSKELLKPCILAVVLESKGAELERVGVKGNKPEAVFSTKYIPEIKQQRSFYFREENKYRKDTSMTSVLSDTKLAPTDILVFWPLSAALQEHG